VPPELLELGQGDGLGAVGGLDAAVQAGGEIVGEPATPTTVAGERADGGDVPVPGGWPAPVPCGGYGGSHLVAGEGGGRLVAAERPLQSVQGLLVRAAGGSGQVGLGEKRRNRAAKGLLGPGEGDDSTGVRSYGLLLTAWWQGMRARRSLPPRRDGEVTLGARFGLWQGMDSSPPPSVVAGKRRTEPVSVWTRRRRAAAPTLVDVLRLCPRTPMQPTGGASQPPWGSSSSRPLERRRRAWRSSSRDRKLTARLAWSSSSAPVLAPSW
jgi:hypothetical protein